VTSITIVKEFKCFVSRKKNILRDNPNHYLNLKMIAQAIANVGAIQLETKKIPSQ